MSTVLVFICAGCLIVMFAALALVTKIYQDILVKYEQPRVRPPIDRSGPAEGKNSKNRRKSFCSKNRRPVGKSVRTSTRHSQQASIDEQPRVESLDRTATKERKKPRSRQCLADNSIRTAKRHPQEHDE